MAQWVSGAATGYSAGGMRYTAVGSRVIGVSGQNRLAYGYDTETGRWERIADTLEERYSHSVVALGETVYALGGVGANGQPTRNVERYDLATGQWQWAGVMHSGRQHAASATVGDAIYSFGGLGSDGYDATLSASIECFEVQARQSRMLDVKLRAPRSRMASVAVGSLVYLLGGMSYQEGGTQITAAMEVFDALSGSVSRLADMPVASAACVAACFERELYCVTGSNLLIYSIEENRWRFGESLPSGVLRGGLVVVGQTLYALPEALGNPALSLDLRTVRVVNPAPTAGFVDEKQDNVFSWQLQANSSAQQERAVFEWRVQGSSAAQSMEVGAQTRVSVPAGTFPDGEIQWRVMAVSTEGIASAWTEWFDLTTVDQPHEGPGNLYPASGKRNATASIQLSWVVNAPLATPQSAYEVEVLADGGWSALSGKQASAVSAHTVAGGTLQPDGEGKVTWRVRTYNSDDAAGAWSDEASFLALTAPETPRWIGVESGRARPLARWVAAGQTGYQLRALRGDEVVYDTGECVGGETEHRPGEYLANGSYTFAVRVQNELRLWSEWALTQVEVAFVSALELTLEAVAEDGAARLRFDVGVK